MTRVWQNLGRRRVRNQNQVSPGRFSQTLVILPLNDHGGKICQTGEEGSSLTGGYWCHWDPSFHLLWLLAQEWYDETSRHGGGNLIQGLSFTYYSISDELFTTIGVSEGVNVSITEARYDPLSDVSFLSFTLVLPKPGKSIAITLNI